MFGDVDIRGQGAGAESPQVDARGAMLAHAEKRGHAGGGLQFDAMALAVIEGERVAFVTVAPRQSEAGG